MILNDVWGVNKSCNEGIHNLMTGYYIIIIFLLRFHIRQLNLKCRAENIIPVFKKDSSHHFI